LKEKVPKKNFNALRSLATDQEEAAATQDRFAGESYFFLKEKAPKKNFNTLRSPAMDQEEAAAAQDRLEIE